MKWLLALALFCGAWANAQDWQAATDGRFVVETASEADREQLAAVFAV